MRRVVAFVAVTAALIAPTATRAFIRSKGTSGACLSWPERRVEFSANVEGRPGQQPVCASGAPLDELTAALDTWGAAARAGDAAGCTDLQLSLAGVTSRTDVGASPNGEPDVNLVVWRRGDCEALAPAGDPCWAPDAQTSCAAKFNCWEYADDATIALTTTSFFVSTGEIVDADVELRAWDGTSGASARGVSGWYFTCFDPSFVPSAACTRYGEVGCVDVDLRSVLAHELGHAIGIADQYSDAQGTMYGYAAPGEILKRTLAADDVEAVCSIYPAGARTPACTAAPLAAHQSVGSGGASGGCASAGGGSGLLGLVVLALAPIAARWNGFGRHDSAKAKRASRGGASVRGGSRSGVGVSW